MMMGRFGTSAGKAWPRSSVTAKAVSAFAPTPAANAPSTEVFTKLRREKVKEAPSETTM
jgi:hypothetical protein